jgi:hypothetical protein
MASEIAAVPEVYQQSVPSGNHVRLASGSRRLDVEVQGDSMGQVTLAAVRVMYLSLASNAMVRISSQAGCQINLEIGGIESD